MSILKDLRIKAGLTQEQAAELCDCSVRALQNREKYMRFQDPRDLGYYLTEVLDASMEEQIKVILEVYGQADFSLSDMVEESEQIRKNETKQMLKTILKKSKSNERMLKQIITKMGINS